MSLRLIEAGSTLPSLGISRTPEENAALVALHDFAFNPDVDLYVAEEDDEENYAAQLELYDARIDELLHPVLYTLLFRHLHHARLLTSTVAVSLVLSLLTTDSKFKRGSVCTQKCAAFQYYIRNTATNELRLHTDNHSKYVPASGDMLIHQDEIASDDFSSSYQYVQSQTAWHRTLVLTKA